jgi:hypothetical protein
MLQRRVVAARAGLEVTPPRGPRRELHLLQGESTEASRRTGAQLFGRFAQPVPHGVGIDLKAPSGSAETSPRGQAGHNPPDQRPRRLLAVAAGARGLQKGAGARRTMALTPRPATGLAMGAPRAPSQPPPVSAVRIRPTGL